MASAFDSTHRGGTVAASVLLMAVALLLQAGLPGSVSAQESLYRWRAADAQAQLAADTTAVPAGQGAIFVPTMTNGDDEPAVLVESGGRRVLDGRTGVRIALDPGSYTVRVGSGTTEQMTITDVRVTAGQTRLVEPTWAGLVIEVVDENNIPFNGTYELIRTEERELFGLGFGADTLQGEPLQTWLLPPGAYRIVRAGSNYRARRDFASAYLPEAGLVHFKLVLDTATGQFLGGGVVDITELAIPGVTTSKWTMSTTVGIGIPLSQSTNVVGANNQTTFGADLVADSYLAYNDGPHSYIAIIEIEEGFVKIDPEQGPSLPTQQTRDRLRFDSVYTYYMTPRLGPYVRFGLLTNMFDANVLATEPTLFQRHFLDGSVVNEDLAANQQFKTAGSFSPVLLREGLGANFRLVRERSATVNVRGGFGFRQNLYSDTFVEGDDPATSAIEYFEIDSFTQEGLEATVTAAMRISGRFLYTTSFDLFGDFGDFGEPVIDWRNILSWRFAGDLSLDYTVNLIRQPQVVDDTQISQSLLLRYSFNR